MRIIPLVIALVPVSLAGCGNEKQDSVKSEAAGSSKTTVKDNTNIATTGIHGGKPFC